MRKKKNRGFLRQLNRELNALRSDNNHLRGILNHRIMRTDDIAASLSSIRNRIRRLEYSHLVDLGQLGVRSYAISTNDIKKQMVDDFLHNEQFLDLIKFEIDDTFCGLGSRYNLSIEVLTPE